MVKSFGDYHQLKARLYSGKRIDVLSAEFAAMAQRISQCMRFLSEHPELRESAQFHSLYAQLRDECLSIMRRFVQQRLRKAQQSEKEQDNHSSDTEKDTLEMRAA